MVGCQWPSQPSRKGGVDIGAYGANRCNVGLLVWAGRRGGDGLAPGSSESRAAASGTRRTPAHELQPWAAVEGGRGQVDCAGGLVTDPGQWDGTIPRRICRA